MQIKNSKYYSKVAGSDIITSININISTVTELCLLGANKGNVYAQYMLGLYYENGIGVEADIKKALEFYEKAAEQGYSKARNKVYIFYGNGSEVKKKIREKVESYKTGH